MRRVIVNNTADRTREIKLYFGHQFEIYKAHGGDTAYFDPISHRDHSLQRPARLSHRRAARQRTVPGLCDRRCQFSGQRRHAPRRRRRAAFQKSDRARAGRFGHRALRQLRRRSNRARATTGSRRRTSIARSARAQRLHRQKNARAPAAHRERLLEGVGQRVCVELLSASPTSTSRSSSARSCTCARTWTARVASSPRSIPTCSSTASTPIPTSGRATRRTRRLRSMPRATPMSPKRFFEFCKNIISKKATSCTNICPTDRSAPRGTRG